jgi:hypothetical protein
VLAELDGRDRLEPKYVLGVRAVYVDAKVDAAHIEMLRASAVNCGTKVQVVDADADLEGEVSTELRLRRRGGDEGNDACAGFYFVLVLDLADRSLHAALVHERFAAHDFHTVYGRSATRATHLAHSISFDPILCSPVSFAPIMI